MTNTEYSEFSKMAGTKFLTDATLFAPAADKWAKNSNIMNENGSLKILQAGSNLSDLTDINSARINLQLRPGVDIQAFSAKLSAYAAGPSPTALALAFLGKSLAQEMRDLIGAGTVNSVTVSGGSTGLVFTNGTITNTGTATLGGVLSVANGGTGASSLSGVKTAIGLGNVDNTSDIDKPVSIQQLAALNLKFNVPSGNTAQYVRGDGSLDLFPTIPPTGIGSVTSVTISGGETGLTVANSTITSSGTATLGGTLALAHGGTGVSTLSALKVLLGINNVDNTRDIDKPVSSAVTIALSSKQDIIEPGETTQYWRGDKTWHNLDKIAVGLGLVDNTADVNKPISNPTQMALDRRVRIPASLAAGATLELPTPVAGKYLAWNLTGTAIVNVDGGTGGGDGQSPVFSFVDVFTGNDVKTEFDLRFDPLAIDNIFVSIGGVVQTPVNDYTWNGGTQINFTSPPPIGEKIVVRFSRAVIQTRLTADFIDTNNFTGTIIPDGANLQVALQALETEADIAKTGIAGKEPSIAIGNTTQYWRGDKTWQTLNKSTIGLGNADNTADSSKAVLSASRFTTSRTINGVSFDGTANIVINAIDSTARIASSEKGAANGVATLDAGGKVPTSQLPSSVLGGVNYQGTWNASSNTPTIPTASSANKGWYYKVGTNGTTPIDGINDWGVGDWIVSNGVTWEKVDNTEQVSSVAGLTGVIPSSNLKTALVLVKADVGLSNVDNTSDANKPVSTAQQTAINNAVSASAATLQPLNNNLTSIAALLTTTFGRSFLTQADAAAGRSLIGLGTSATVNTGTSGAVIPLLSTGNTWAAIQTISHPSSASALQVEAIGGQESSLRLNTGTSRRWKIAKTSSAESGSNVGSNYVLYRYDDAGVQLGQSMVVERATGDITIEGVFGPNIDNNKTLGSASLRWANVFSAAVTTANAQITGGTITGITDIAIADGGTGSSTAAGARTNLGLGNVDNTSDANKPISTATQTALNLKASTALATSSASGLMASSDFVKLSGVATGATANDTDTNLKNRANHTGTQAISTITGLQAAIDNKAPSLYGIGTTYTDGTVHRRVQLEVYLTDFLIALGLPTDGSAFIDDALDNAVAYINGKGGGVVHIPAGEWKVGRSHVFATVDKCHIRGADYGCTALMISFAAGDVLCFGNGTSNPNNSSICNIHFYETVTRTSGANIRFRNGHNLFTIRTRHATSATAFRFEGGTSQYLYYMDEYHVYKGAIGLHLPTPADGEFQVQELWVGHGSINECTTAGILIRAGSGIYFDKGVCSVLRCKKGISLAPNSVHSLSACIFNGTTSDTNQEEAWWIVPENNSQIRAIRFNNCWGCGSGKDGTARHNFHVDGVTGFVSTLTFSQCQAEAATGHGMFFGTNVRSTTVLAPMVGNNNRIDGNYSGISIGNANGVQVIGGSTGWYLSIVNLSNLQKYGVTIDSSASNVKLIGVDLRDNVTAPILDNATDTVVESCVGYKAKARIACVLPSGQTSVTIPHTLSAQPALHQVTITPIDGYAGFGTINQLRVVTTDATGIQVTANAAPTADFRFAIDVGIKGN